MSSDYCINSIARDRTRNGNVISTVIVIVRNALGLAAWEGGIKGSASEAVDLIRQPATDLQRRLMQKPLAWTHRAGLRIMVEGIIASDPLRFARGADRNVT